MSHGWRQNSSSGFVPFWLLKVQEATCAARWKEPPLHTTPLPHLHHLHCRPPQKRCYLFIKSEALACGGGQEGMRRTTQPKLFLLVNVFVFRFGKDEVVVSHGAPPPLAALHTIPISPTRPPPQVEGPKSCCNSGTDANQLARLQR